MNCVFEDWTPLIREAVPPPDIPVATVLVPDELLERYVAAKNVYMGVVHELERYDPTTRRES